LGEKKNTRRRKENTLANDSHSKLNYVGAVIAFIEYQETNVVNSTERREREREAHRETSCLLSSLYPLIPIGCALLPLRSEHNERQPRDDEVVVYSSHSSFLVSPSKSQPSPLGGLTNSGR